MAFSDFVEQSLIAQPQWLAELETPPGGAGVASLCRLAAGSPGRVNDEAALMRELRLFRRRIMVRIAWAQALSLVSEESTCSS
jgi:glutamate-ammonia-ligase adenylyltransferase